MAEDGIRLGTRDAAAAGGQLIEPSIRTALPHFLPVAVFPLILVAAAEGGWWILAPFVFFFLTGPMDMLFGRDERNMDPANTPESRLFWHNLPLWLWAVLWPVTFVFTMWQIFVVGHLSFWESGPMVAVLTIEAQAIFIVGHELIHRRSTWERRLGEFLLASASYPQYATEHVHVHHALVGTPLDVGSAPKGQSFWRYFPREVASNFTSSWKVVRERLARRRLPVWHRSNPFWRYGLETAAWYAFVYWMAGPWAIPVYVVLCLLLVFSMKLSNYIQHYGLRRVRLPSGRYEKARPRHSWSASYRFSNWMFYNMQRHADHHAVASRQFPLLQFRGGAESPQMPGNYGEMFGLALRPRRWFEKMDPLVDQWRAHFYPEIDDWRAYDSPVSEARPEAFELLDNLQDREFTDLDIPGGFGPNEDFETTARRGLARLYWTYEFDVGEMRSQISEIPAQDSDEAVDVVRNWSNDKAFQIGMHTLRGNLSPVEAGTALANLAEASIAAVLAAVEEDLADRRGPCEGWIAAAVLGDLAGGDAAPDAELEVLLVHDGVPADYREALCRGFLEALRALSQANLLFAPAPRGGKWVEVRPLADFALSAVPAETLLRLVRARRVFACGDPGIGIRFDEARRTVLVDGTERDAAIAALRAPAAGPAEPGLASLDDMRGGLRDVERAARFVQLAHGPQAPELLAGGAASAFRTAGARGLVAAETAGRLEEAARTWRNLRGMLRLIADDGFAVEAAPPKVRAAIALSCECEDSDAVDGMIRETAARAALDIDALCGMGADR